MAISKEHTSRYQQPGSGKRNDATRADKSI